jgi:hypothetical protein
MLGAGAETIATLTLNSDRHRASTWKAFADNAAQFNSPCSHRNRFKALLTS